jgi:predicted membrane protein
MPTAPRAIRFTLVLFNISVVVAGAMGIVFIWDPPESETVIRAFTSVLVVFAVCMLILGGYRTVHFGSKGGD